MNNEVDKKIYKKHKTKYNDTDIGDLNELGSMNGNDDDNALKKKKIRKNKLKKKLSDVRSKLKNIKSKMLENSRSGKSDDEQSDGVDARCDGVDARDDSRGSTDNEQSDGRDNSREDGNEQSEDDRDDGNEQSEDEDKDDHDNKDNRNNRRSEKTVKWKKGPGRPRKIPKKEPIPRKGISANPTNPEYTIELLYDMPILIKKILVFFKSLASLYIQVLFRKDNIIFYAKDHHNMSKIRCLINANKLNHYYCKNNVDIGMSTKDLEMILNKVDKDYSSIIMLSTTNNTQKNFTIILENSMQIDEIHNIDVIGNYDHMNDENEFSDENYMIQFSWPGKYFRKTINDIKTISDQVSFVQEDCNSPFTIEYISMHKKIHSKHSVKNLEKIKYISKLQANDSFRVDVRIDNIRPISSSHIADEITILIDENKKFMTRAYIDNGTIEIKTLTKIIDHRNIENTLN